jgi:16S rRNA (cytidine1402-2'-O)-methyltransferase
MENDPPEASNATPSLAPGLYLVATPIGAARDVTLRALDVLATADVLAAEDTRQARKLLDIHGIRRAARGIVPYHDHNGAVQRPRLLAALAEGRSVALVSDAGTPLVADPGYRLATEAIAAGHAVHAVPGASALLAALAVAGLPTDRFLFAGFPPPKAGERRRFLADLATIPATLVLFEAPGRTAQTLVTCHEVLGDREAALCRELTKRFEEVRRGRLGALAEEAGRTPPRGEVVLVIDRAAAALADEAQVARLLTEALGTMSVKDAAAHVADTLSLPRRQVYQSALALARSRGD